MLLKNVKIQHKNHILFKCNNNIYYQEINNDNKLNLFNRNLINIFLNQFEDTLGIVTYDDIVQMSAIENHDTAIIDLPNNLCNLTIMSTMCSRIVFSDNVSSSIENISIDKSNITQFPNIRNCRKLKTCKINHSAITDFSIDYDLPDSLFELNLQGNLIKNVNVPFSYDKLDVKTLFKKNFSDNYLNYDLFPEKIRLKSNLVRQYTYKHNPINFINVRNENIHHFIGGLGLVVAPIQESPFFGSQSVHLSSINKSILTSFNNMMEFIEKNNIKLKELNEYTILERIINLFNPQKERIINTSIQELKTNSAFVQNMAILTTNSMTKKTYKETFIIIWSILCFKHEKETIDLNDAINRIIVELNDGKGMCFTGVYNRLINSVVGIIEGVQVGLSEAEELQLEIGKIITNLNDTLKPDYAFNNAICDAKQTLEFVKDVNVKNAWLDAIYDLKPDNEKINYKGTTYLRTWDHDILDLREKEIIGYYNEAEQNILFINDL